VTSIRVSLQTAFTSSKIRDAEGPRFMFPTLLAALPEAVGGLLRGLGEAVFSWFVAGVGLVGHDRCVCASLRRRLQCSAPSDETLVAQRFASSRSF